MQLNEPSLELSMNTSSLPGVLDCIEGVLICNSEARDMYSCDEHPYIALAENWKEVLYYPDMDLIYQSKVRRADRPKE